MTALLEKHPLFISGRYECDSRVAPSDYGSGNNRQTPTGRIDLLQQVHKGSPMGVSNEFF